MYFTIFGICESYDDASYERDVEDDSGNVVQEKVPQWTLTLAVPGMRDLVRVNVGKDFAVPTQQAQKWEDAGNVMVKVQADRFSLTTGIRNKKAWGLVSFHAVSQPGEASADETRQLASDRKRVKAVQKAAREKARAEKAAKAARSQKIPA